MTKEKLQSCPPRQMMRMAVIVLAIGLLLAGCASQPRPTGDKAANESALGFMLLSDAASHDPSAMASMEVHIPRQAIQLVSSIDAYRARTGRWPKRDDLTFPAGISDVRLSGDAPLDFVLMGGKAVVFHCRISPDGSVTVAPPFEALMALMKSVPTREPAMAVPPVPITPR